ncbi:hypothetical protein AM587_10003453 [Phytophthora nicotianae]|uniref:Uncharacterized protein n=1 Tax=Phytophthora nicotianae TaxID=4792 RepID=A0A0W8CI02_PHYNI|nr:hypothetical protein AM587_10003453 [Phytophthora nicotianae]
MVHDVYGHRRILQNTEEEIIWVVNSANTRIAVPAELSDGVSDAVVERKTDATEWTVYCVWKFAVSLIADVVCNHWCGIVFVFGPGSRSITMFDPLQAGKSKYYNMYD